MRVNEKSYIYIYIYNVLAVNYYVRSHTHTHTHTDSITDIVEHPWFNGPIIDDQELFEELSKRKQTVDTAKQVCVCVCVCVCVFSIIC
jgi:hypothetical protein